MVDLGCGSGLRTQELTKTCYRVLGIDIYEAMIDRYRARRVPEAEFRVGSLFESNVPTCDAFTSIGEISNCQLIQGMTNRRCSTLPPRIRCPDSRRRLRVRHSGASTGHAGCREQGGSPKTGMVGTRRKGGESRAGDADPRITSSRKVRHLYNRADEVHRLAAIRIDVHCRRTPSNGLRVRTIVWLWSVPAAEGSRGVSRT